MNLEVDVVWRLWIHLKAIMKIFTGCRDRGVKSGWRDPFGAGVVSRRLTVKLLEG